MEPVHIEIRSLIDYDEKDLFFKKSPVVHKYI